MDVEQLTQAEWDSLYREAFKLIGHVQDAEDIVGQAILESLEAKRKNGQKPITGAWVIMCLRNRCADYWRAKYPDTIKAGDVRLYKLLEQLALHNMTDGERRSAQEWRDADRFCDSDGHIHGYDDDDDPGAYA